MKCGPSLTIPFSRYEVLSLVMVRIQVFSDATVLFGKLSLMLL